MKQILSEIHWFIYTKTGQFDEVIFSLPFLAVAALIYRLGRRKRLRRMFGESFDEVYADIRTRERLRLCLFCWFTELIFVTLMPTEFWGGFWRGLPTEVIFNIRLWHFSFSPPKLIPGILRCALEGHPENFFMMLPYAAPHYAVNMLLFFPLGVLLPLLYEKANCAKTVLCGLTLSAIIEFLQMFISRDSDMDDVISNALGALLGYLVFLLVKRIFPGVENRARVTACDRRTMCGQDRDPL